MAVFGRISGFVVCVVASAAVGACDSPTTPTSGAPYSQVDVRVGTGTEAVNGTIATVHYTGWLFDRARTDQKGLQFESSAGFDAFAFTLGTGEVIPGWDRGVAGMRVGGLRRLVIPPSLAYGDRRNGPIPPHSTLVYEIELLAVEQPEPE